MHLCLKQICRKRNLWRENLWWPKTESASKSPCVTNKFTVFLARKMFGLIKPHRTEPNRTGSETNLAVLSIEPVAIFVPCGSKDRHTISVECPR